MNSNSTPKLLIIHQITCTDGDVLAIRTKQDGIYGIFESNTMKNNVAVKIDKMASLVLIDGQQKSPVR